MILPLLSLATVISKGPIPLVEGIFRTVPGAGATAVRQDLVEEQLRMDPAFSPKAGADDWKPIQAAKDGVFSGPAVEGGWIGFSVSFDRDQTLVLTAEGPSISYINGEPRVGDVYSSGIAHLPVHVHAGSNEFLFRCARGRLKAYLEAPEKPVALDMGDSTLPDRIVGHPAADWAALLVRNSTDQTLDHLAIRAGSGNSRNVTSIGPIGPMTVRKVGFRLPKSDGEAVTLTLLSDGKTVDETVTKLRRRKPLETQKRTFVSGIDGSVQYYGLNPASDPAARALVLSLHGAGVEAIGQADAYSAKSWISIACPTNRRPFGFDWEDWGRQDAIEVLDEATRFTRPDPSRIYLAGHSMGGHGTWQLGSLYPDKFAAIGPSAGWISAFTYAGGKRTAPGSQVGDLMQRALEADDTMKVAHNTGTEGVYILHGDADDNVPVTEARAMAKELGTFHHDFILHEQPGQGHWWDLSDEPGADCVDWAPLFDFFGRHALTSTTQREIDFTTLNPGVSATDRWVTVEAVNQVLVPAEVHVRCDPYQRRIVGTTTNVARIRFDLSCLAPGTKAEFDLNGQKIWLNSPGKSVTLLQAGGYWAAATAKPEEKSPSRYGPFRAAFSNRMVLVYGTTGSPEENAWAYARARFDAETWWYRGNGSVDVVSDRAFDPEKDRDRSVVLYGNRNTNRMFANLLKDSPIDVTNQGVRMGGRNFAGADLTCVFLWPRPGSTVASVAVISGTGIEGMRGASSLPYLQPMTGFPDALLIDSKTRREGAASALMAGFFGRDWSVESGEFAFRNP